MGLMKAIYEGVVRKAAHQKTAGRGGASFIAGLVATRIATRSIPGALLVGGGLLAKHLYDRKKERDPTVDSVKDRLARDPKLAADIARDKPELLTDAGDDKDLAAEIEKRTGDKPEAIAPA